MNRLSMSELYTSQKQGKAEGLRCHGGLDAAIRLSVALLIAQRCIIAGQGAQPAVQNPLQIVSAGVETSEDAPFVANSYRFLPGDYVYCQFQIAGYAVQKKEDSEVRKISLTYEITPQDGKGVPLATPVGEAIQEDVGTEDKNWTPKRRASFLLPSFIAAGDFHVHIVVKDVIGKISTERDLPFHIGGTVVVPTEALNVQDFQFLRKEDDAEGLDLPAYAPGDTVYARFTMTGFRLGAANEYQLSYGLTVSRPDGKSYLNEPNAAKLTDKSFYPITFVPSNLSVTTTRTAAKGQYILVLTVRDLLGSQSYQLKRTFSVE
jgi:hypothetical protein